MNIQALQHFITTAELLHFGRASQACNLSPSALTRTIQRLEEELKQPLFIRDNRSVTLTASGDQLLVYARNAVHEWDQFRTRLCAEPSVAGTLSLYASITAVYSLLPELLEAYRSAFPNVQLALRTGAAETAMEHVLQGGIDLAVAALPEKKPARLEFLPLAKTPLVFIAPHPMKQIDFTTDTLIVPQAGVARQRLDMWLKQRGITPHISTEVAGNEALIAMVRLGAGVGIVPQLALERSPLRDEIHEVERAPKLAPYVVGLCSSKRNLKRPAAQAMWQLATSLGGPNG